MKIGLVGEAPNDTLAMRNLLLKRYSELEYEFIDMLDNIPGSLLDHQKTKRLLRLEYQIKKPDWVIFIRDLDALVSDRKKLNQRRNYFTSSNSVVDKKGTLMLHIFEIEALILADIETFNEIYGTSVDKIENPMSIHEPKELLKSFSKKYNEIHNGKIFEKIDFDKAMECAFFFKFIRNFDKALSRI